MGVARSNVLRNYVAPNKNIYEFRFMSYAKHLRLLAGSLILCLSLFQCATQRAPSGGPVDRTPPRVISTAPVADSLHIQTDLERIHLKFSERMSQSTLAGNIYISPPLQFEVDWQNWEEADLILQEPLNPDQTYVISVATGVQDLQRNKLAQSFQFAFSTGAKIDGNQISGRVFGLDKKSTVNIFAWVLSDSSIFDPGIQVPQYISKTGDKGKYKLAYLKNGTYRVLAVDDQNRNLLADIRLEKVGIAWQDIVLNEDRPVLNGLNFRMSRVDTSAPEIQMVRPLYRNLLQVRFSEKVYSEDVRGLAVVDSINGDSLQVRSIDFDPEYDNTWLLSTAPMDSNHRYGFSVDSICDSLANCRNTMAPFYFSAIADTDTTTFAVLIHEPADSVRNVSPETHIRLRFSAPPEKRSLNEAFSLLSNGGKEIPGHWVYPDAYRAEFIPRQNLLPDSSYRTVLDRSVIRSIAGKGLADSVESHYFSIVSSRELGSLSGKIAHTQEFVAPVSLRVQGLKRGAPQQRMYVMRKQDFVFENLPEGRYVISGFLDEDGNGRYSYGRLYPFSWSEPFTVAKDTVKVRKRWESGNLQFKLPHLERSYEPVDSVR